MQVVAGPARAEDRDKHELDRPNSTSFTTCRFATALQSAWLQQAKRAAPGSGANATLRASGRAHTQRKP